MQTLFITATGTNVGKTFTTLQLIKAFSKRNISIGVCKPIETGVVDAPLDAQLLLKACQAVNPTFVSFNPKDITAYTFSLPAAPFSADTKQTIQIETIMNKIDELSSYCDLLIIEGAGGLMVPITRDFMMIDLAKKLDGKVLLVTPSRLGCINDTLLSIEALRSREIDFDWCVNLYEDSEDFAQATQPFYDAIFGNYWFVEEGLDNFISTLK
ncbi:MAG: dethiobiotin synthase [Epsilonproteobacteria bacterium]|nr:MAG: dethiobiotin synthase [Campylobacterota bacterium]